MGKPKNSKSQNMKLAQQEIEDIDGPTEAIDNYQVDDQVKVPVNDSFLATAQFWILVFVLVGIGAVVYVLISKKKQQREQEEAEKFNGQVHDDRNSDHQKI